MNQTRPAKNTRAVIRTAAKTSPGRTRTSGTARNARASRLSRRLLKSLLVVVGCLLAGTGVGAGAKAIWDWMTTSPRLAINEVVVRTGDRVSEEEVRMLSNIKEGDNILGFSLVECVEAINIHPWVREASVMRRLPDRVVIEIVEREPVALAALGSLYYVDGDGEIFKKVLPGENLEYPVFTGLTLREVVEDKPGIEPLILDGLALIELSRTSKAMPLDQMSEIHLDRQEGITLVRSSDGLRISFGAGRLGDKWSRMERAIEELSSQTRRVAELDLNYEGRVTIRLKDGYRVASAEDVSGGK